MSVKTVTCVICGEQVTKRKSLQYKSGRACREHKEVINDIAEKKEELEIKECSDSVRLQMVVNTLVADEIRLSANKVIIWELFKQQSGFWPNKLFQEIRKEYFEFETPTDTTERVKFVLKVDRMNRILLTIND